MRSRPRWPDRPTSWRVTLQSRRRACTTGREVTYWAPVSRNPEGLARRLQRLSPNGAPVECQVRDDNRAPLVQVKTVQAPNWIPETTAWLQSWQVIAYLITIDSDAAMFAQWVDAADSNFVPIGWGMYSEACAGLTVGIRDRYDFREEAARLGVEVRYDAAPRWMSVQAWRRDDGSWFPDPDFARHAALVERGEGIAVNSEHGVEFVEGHHVPTAAERAADAQKRAIEAERRRNYDPVKFRCPPCGVYFTTEALLNDHLKTSRRHQT